MTVKNKLTAVALVALFAVLAATFASAQPAPGFSKTAPLSGSGTLSNPLKLNVCPTSGHVYASNGTAMVCVAQSGGGGGITDGDKGDITVSGTGSVWTIDAAVVTLAKMANLATARFICRVTAGTGDPEACTGTQATTLLDTFTTSLKGLAPASGGGTANFMRADGTWAVPPGTATGTVTGTGGVNFVPKWTSTTALGNSNIADSGTAVGIGVATNIVGNLTENSNRVFSAVGTGLSSSTNTVNLNMTGASCATGTRMSALSATGTGTCSADVTAITAGTGITAPTVSGTATITANLAGASCSAGSHMSALSATGTGTCTADTPADITQSITGSTGSVNALAVGATTTILYWTQSGTVGLNGITNGAAGRRFKMVLNSTQLLGLQVENAGATATDRIMAPGGADQTFQGPTVIEWAYDTVNSRWTYGPISKYMNTAVIAAGATITAGGLTITAGGLSVASGNATIQQSLTVNDNTTLGNAAGDVTSLVGEMGIIDGSGKLSTKATSSNLTLTTCGTSPTVSGDRTSATVTTGTGATACTITFTNAFNVTPTCMLQTQSATKSYSYTVSTTAITISTAQASTKYDYFCVDHY